MENLKIKNAYTIEIPFVANEKSVKIGNQDFLNDKRVKQIILFHASQVSKTPLGKTTISSADLANTYLTVVVDGKDKLKRIPATMLNLLANPQNQPEFDNLIIDWANSEFIFSDEVSASSLLMLVIYQ